MTLGSLKRGSRFSALFVVLLMLVASAFLVVFVLPVHATGPTLVQTGSTTNTATSVACTLSSTVTAGDTVPFMIISTQQSHAESFSDSLSGLALTSSNAAPIATPTCRTWCASTVRRWS